MERGPEKLGEVRLSSPSISFHPFLDVCARFGANVEREPSFLRRHEPCRHDPTLSDEVGSPMHDARRRPLGDGSALDHPQDFINLCFAHGPSYADTVALLRVRLLDPDDLERLRRRDLHDLDPPGRVPRDPFPGARPDRPSDGAAGAPRGRTVVRNRASGRRYPPAPSHGTGSQPHPRARRPADRSAPRRSSGTSCPYHRTCRIRDPNIGGTASGSAGSCGRAFGSGPGSRPEGWSSRPDRRGGRRVIDYLGVVRAALGAGPRLDPLAELAVERPPGALPPFAPDLQPDRFLAGQDLGLPPGPTREAVPLERRHRVLRPLGPDIQSSEQPAAERAGLRRRGGFCSQLPRSRSARSGFESP